MNNVILIGNLARDPELLETNNGLSLCKFSIAVNRSFTTDNGDRECDFFDIVVWDKLGENCGKFLEKGKKVGVVGRIQNRSYEDRNGNKRTVTEIVAESVEFLTAKHDEGTTTTVKRQRPALEEIGDNDDFDNARAKQGSIYDDENLLF